MQTVTSGNGSLAAFANRPASALLALICVSLWLVMIGTSWRSKPPSAAKEA